MHAGLEDGAADGGDIADADLGDGGFISEVEIIAGEMEEQVATGADMEGGELGGAGVADAFGVLDRGCKGDGGFGGGHES